MKLIDGRKDAQEAARREREIERNGLFLCAYAKHLARYCETGGTDDLIKAFVAGVHFLATEERFDVLEWRGNVKLARALFCEHSCVTKLAARLSPRKVAELFPPRKAYNGGGVWKDYFSSVQAVKDAGDDKPFQSVDEARAFLWGYDNESLNDMAVGGLQVLSYLQTVKGEPDLIDGFMSEQAGEPVHVPDYHRVKDREGRSWIYTDTGECLGREARPRRPKWLHAVKD